MEQFSDVVNLAAVGIISAIVKVLVQLLKASNVGGKENPQGLTTLIVVLSMSTVLSALWHLSRGPSLATADGLFSLITMIIFSSAGAILVNTVWNNLLSEKFGGKAIKNGDK